MSRSLTRREFVGAATLAAAIPWLPRTSGPGADGVAPLGPPAPEQVSMDRDLMEVTIPGLQAMYVAKKYTVTQVTKWYLDRIARYNKVYRALLHVDTAGALAAAAALDAAATRGGSRGPLWGVPMVIKSNTSVKGLVTSAGFAGYLIPGLELIAPMDATVVVKLRAAGVVILAQTNMPDFASSDGNTSTAYGRTGDAYNWRYSPGGSSGGTVTAVTANMALIGTGTDTANSIRMPAATSAVVGYMPTRGVTSIAGINPLDWLRDNTGPIARTVTDAAIALGVMAGEDPRDFRTKGSAALVQPGPYTQYLKADALRGKRIGVPAFIVAEASAGGRGGGGTPLQPETRALFMKSLDGLRAAGATVVFDDALLPASFSALTGMVSTRAYIAEGTESFLRDYGPPQYHSSKEYAEAVGAPLPTTVIPLPAAPAAGSPPPAPQAPLASDPQAEATLWAPQRQALAAYHAAFDQFQLDALAYPAIQMPPFDEVALAVAGQRSGGPHSNTGWVNRIGIPAVSIPGGFYDDGLPFGLELAARQWKDGDLLGYAFAYEQATHHRKPPVLVETR